MDGTLKKKVIDLERKIAGAHKSSDSGSALGGAEDVDVGSGSGGSGLDALRAAPRHSPGNLSR